MRATILTALAFALAACASTTEPTPQAAPAGPEASIPFADFGSIRTWRAGPNDTLLLQGSQGRWYQAAFRGSCPDVRFTEALGVISNASGSVDRFSAVVVRGRRCLFRSLIEIPDPNARVSSPAQ